MTSRVHGPRWLALRTPQSCRRARSAGGSIAYRLLFPIASSSHACSIRTKSRNSIAGSRFGCNSWAKRVAERAAGADHRPMALCHVTVRVHTGWPVSASGLYELRDAGAHLPGPLRVRRTLVHVEGYLDVVVRTRRLPALVG